MKSMQSFALIVVFWAALWPVSSFGKVEPPAALAGRVTSQEEGPMEGVVVSAKKQGTTVTISVVSDAQGRFSFPRTRLDSGGYSIAIRAVGYELDEPGTVEVGTQKANELDLKLHKAADLSAQLTNTEWLMSMPGTPQQKWDLVYTDCLGCHSLQRVVRSRYNADEFAKFVSYMLQTFTGGSTSHHVQKRIGPLRTVYAATGGTGRHVDTEYLSSVNLSKTGKWDYPLKTLPRVTGRGTRVIVTEYDLPRADATPHDAVVDRKGMVWYCDFGEQYIGKLDPKTAKVADFPVPQVKPGLDTGMNDIEVDRDGSLWVALFNQAGLAKFDPKTQKFQTWRLPKEIDPDARRTVFVASNAHEADGKIWLGGGRGVWGTDLGQLRVDLKTGKWEEIHEWADAAPGSPAATRPHGIYGIAADSKNNLYDFDYESEYLVKVDAKTLKASFYAAPTINSGPRRGHVDAQDRVWFAEHHVSKIGMFDPRTEQFKEWTLPTPFSNPYDAVADKNGEVWTGGMASDRVVRLNSKTGEFVEYPLPRPTNIRRVDVDNSTNPVTFWTGNKDGASIVKVEPLD